jgi:putative DNA modification/repair radical SAM protein
MELARKLTILADAAKYDASCASSGSARSRDENGIGDTRKMGICHSYTPDGRCVSLLKILLTNYCIYDCAYCVNRISSDTQRARFAVDEVVRLTIDFYKRNYIEGLFLSSGIIQDADYTMEQLNAVARKLRYEENYNGYIHLKAVPGVSALLLREAALLADRLSVNIELATQADLDRLAPAKAHSSIEQSMNAIKNVIAESSEDKSLRHAPAGQSTQMIVGATPSSDSVILAKSSTLYQDYKLRRVYYSAFSPVPHSDPLLPVKPPPLVREHRLYQADWLMRYYGFEARELTTDAEPNLTLDHDPKLAWALRHREFFPVDINRAAREALLRVPGFGVRNVSRILKMRPHRAVSYEDLRKLRIPLKRAQHFITAAGMSNLARHIDSEKLSARLAGQRQLSLFEAPATAITGEL